MTNRDLFMTIANLPIESNFAAKIELIRTMSVTGVSLDYKEQMVRYYLKTLGSYLSPVPGALREAHVYVFNHSAKNVFQIRSFICRALDLPFMSNQFETFLLSEGKILQRVNP